MSDINDEVFNLVTEANNFKVVKHNQTDFGSFRNFQQNMDSIYGEIDAQRSVNSRRANLQKWDSMLPPPWNTARLDKITDENAVNKATELIKEHGCSSFFIKGEKGTGKTFLALAIARRFIGAGYLSPSQIKHISEDDMLNIARSGFKMSDRIAELLDPRIKLFIIDNVGFIDTYDNNMTGLWSQFFEHVSKRNLMVIFTSQFSANHFMDKLAANSQAKLSYLITGRIITMSGVHAPPLVDDDPTEAEAEQLQRDEQETTSMRNFSAPTRRVKKK